MVILLIVGQKLAVWHSKGTLNCTFLNSPIQKIFFVLPTTYYVYSPAKIFTNASIETAFGLLGLEILSAVFLYVLIRILYKKGVEKINVNGG